MIFRFWLFLLLLSAATLGGCAEPARDLRKHE